MSDDLQASELPLLSVCAIVTYFDRDMLLSLGHDDSAVALLLGSDRVLPMPDVIGAFRLREDIATAARTWLHAEHPGAELSIHEQAFDYFLQQLSNGQAAERRFHDERACFDHLAALRLQLSERREWGRIQQLLARAADARPRQHYHLQLLSLYHGFVAIRTQDYVKGEAILAGLLDEAGSSDNIRMYALNFLAQSHWFQTHYDRALILYRKVDTIATALGDHTYHAHALHNMSLVYYEIGDYAQALSLSEQSLQQFRVVGDTEMEAHLLYEVAKNAMQLGRLVDAERYFRESILLIERLGMTAQLANAYSLHGLLYHALGDEAKSEALYLRSLQIGESPEHGDVAVTMDTWLELGLLYRTQRRWQHALDAYGRAADLARKLNNTYTLVLSSFRRGDVYKAIGPAETAISVYKESIDLIETMRGAADIEEVKLGLLGTTQQVYESLVLLLLAQEQPVDAYHFVERARSRAFLDLLAAHSPELYDTLDQPIVTLAEVQARLPDNALMIEYFTTGVVPRDERLINQIPASNARLREHLTLPPQVILFAVSRDRFEVHFVALDPNSLQSRPNDPGRGRRLLGGRLLTHLYDRLITPVQHLVDAATQLIIVPHGPLHYVPFGALHSAENRYLLQAGGPALAFAPSATVLLRSCLARPAARGEGLLALGYNDEGDAALLYSEAEAQAIAELMNGEAWTGPEPKRERLIEHGRHARLLHIAGHAVFDVHDPLASHVRLGKDDTLSAREIIARLGLDADVVTLSSCTSGLSQVVAGDELLGLQRALLYAGAPTLVCSLWETADLVSLLVMERFYANLRSGRAVAVALCEAQVWIRDLTGAGVTATLERLRETSPEYTTVPTDTMESFADMGDTCPFADPFHWAPFMAIGRP